MPQFAESTSQKSLQHVPTGDKAVGHGKQEMTSTNGLPGSTLAGVQLTPGDPSSGIMSVKPSS